MNNTRNFGELTVVVLKEQAKALGIKGAYKMKKAELIEALNNVELKGEETMENNTVLNNEVEVEMNGVVEMNKGLVNGVELNNKEVVNMNNVDFAKLNNMEAAERQAVLLKVAANAKLQNRLGFNIIKKEAKAIKTVSMIRVEFGVRYVNKQAEIYVDTFVQPSQESSLVRACEIKTGKLADKIMVADGLYVDEIITVSFAKSILGKSKAVKKLFNRVMDMLFTNPNNPFATDTTGLLIKFNTTTGVVAKVDEIGILADDEIVVEYEFMGITPSGLRSASVICAATKRHSNKGTVDVDRRIALLEEAMDGAFSCNFLDKNGSFKTLTNLEKLFKDSTRITQCAPGSQVIMDVENYVVADNIAKNATFNGVAADSVTDGNVRISTEALIEKYYRVNNIPVSFSQVNGTCAQYRGASLKCSGTSTKRRDVAMLAKMAIAYEEVVVDEKTGEEKILTNVAFIVVDGVRMTRDEFLALSVEDRNEFFNKIEMLGDMNAFKLDMFNPVFKLVKLKEAYASQSESNMVVNMAMLQVAPEEAKEFLIKRAKEQLCRKFAKLGVSFELNAEGMPIPTEFKLEASKEFNNSSQFIDYIFNCDRAKVAAMLPGVLRSIVSNEVKGIRRIVNELKIDLDSRYMVVQSDMAALFGQTILAENEIFCKDFTVAEVSAVRHPISSIFAVTTFNVVSLEEVLHRIDRLPVGADTKNAIADFYIYAKGYVVLPASEYLMEKHDGMDWDIDAMQIILDQEAVAILRRLPNIGSKISKANDWMRKTTLNGEAHIKEKNFVRPEIEKTAPTKAENNTVTSVAAAFNRAKNVTSYNYDFNNVGKYVARDFFSSDVANVGEIATAFYNNVCILNALRSTTVDEVVKAAIVKEFNSLYKCSSKVAYKSVIVQVQEGDKITYDSNKMDCCEAIFRFAESTGTQADLEEFLMDCIYLNRFLAETSIDAAKNRFFVMNMFNHAKIVRALGSDKNMTIVVTDNKENANAIYSQRFSALGLENTDMNSNNFFNIEMLTTEIKGVDLSELEAARHESAVQASLTGKEPKDVALAVVDPLAAIRKELTVFANDLIVLFTKLAENEVTSLEGQAIREYVINAAEQLENKNEIRACLYAINNAYATITTCAKSAETFEDKAAKDYMNTVAVQACRNMATLGLAGVDAYSIGLCTVALMCEIKTTEVTAINPALLKVLEREIVEFLSVMGVENIGMIGETLMYAKNNGRLVKLSDYAGTEVVIENGKAYLEDGTIIVAKDKKANIEGVVTETEYGFAVVGERKYTEDNLSVGAYFKFDTRRVEINGMTNCKGKFIPVSYEFHADYKVNNKPYFNVVVAYNAEGQYKIVGSMSANSNIVTALEGLTLTNDNFKVFTNANGKSVFFLGGAECEAIVSAMNADSEFEGELFAPADFDMELSTPQDAAVESNEFYFDEDFSFDGEFGLPQ